MQKLAYKEHIEMLCVALASDFFCSFFYSFFCVSATHCGIVPNINEFAAHVKGFLDIIGKEKGKSSFPLFPFPKRSDD